MRSHLKVDVVWDGTRVYRVPYPGEIEAIRLLSLGHSTRQASQLLGLDTKDGAQRRANEAQSKLHAISHPDTLYRMYRLQLLPSPYDPDLQPVLDEHQRAIFDVTVRMGLAYDHAHKMLGIGRNTLVRRMEAIAARLGAATRCHMMAQAVAHGDVAARPMSKLWRGEV